MMRNLFVTSSLLVTVGVAVAVQSSFGTPPAPEDTAGLSVEIAPKTLPIAKADRLVVHEWGTFTSFSGSNGVKLAFRPLVDNDLPNFVLDRGRQSGKPNPFSKVGIPVLQRMETPVTYFYTDRERDVRVRVGFPEGLLTEFYPPVAAMEPAFDWKAKTPPVSDSVLDWGTVHLIPTDHLATDVRTPELRKRIEHELTRALLPGTAPLVPGPRTWVPWATTSSKATHYYHARETDSAIVHVRRDVDPKRPLLPSGDFFEKFLFYRGVGNFELPLELTARGEGRFTLRNAGPDDVRGLFLVTVDDEESIRFTRYDSVAAKGSLELQQTDRKSTIDALAADVESVLVGTGLYRKEAAAMVATWRDSWFGERGTRLFYLVPDRVTEDLLPLTVDPKPDETVRVLVGRLEIMSPEDESRVARVVAESAARRKQLNKRPKAEQKADPVTPKKMITPLSEELGRLLEPGLVRVKEVSQDATVRYEAARLLRELQQWYREQAE